MKKLILIILLLSGCHSVQPTPVNNLTYFGVLSTVSNYQLTGFDTFGAYTNWELLELPDMSPQSLGLIQSVIAAGKEPVIGEMGALIAVGCTDPSQGTYCVAPDAVTRLQAYAAWLAPVLPSIHYMYLVDEPMVNGVSNATLAAAATAVKSVFPNVKLIMDESGLPQYLNALTIPPTIDVMGIDIYDVLDPSTDAGYQTAWTTMLGKLSASQQVVVIPQAFWYPAEVNVAESQIPTVAANYWKLAQSSTKVMGIMAFEWPSPLGHKKTKRLKMTGAIGLSGLPDAQTAYRSIGCTVTNLCLGRKP